MKLSLPSVTLIAIDSVNPKRSSDVLEICKRKIDFGAVKLLTHEDIDYPHVVKIMPLTSFFLSVFF